AGRHLWLRPATILKFATVNGARALNRSGLIGVLSPGSLADLIALPCNAPKGDLAEAILDCTKRPVASMIDGRWALSPS
ncbi:MAG TPA: amidohydrolase family protein, partial [Verrucomicrobiae bacterium]|nr:amidohydrolase family protein [Verrucomicrobiae bacterium]